MQSDTWVFIFIISLLVLTNFGAAALRTEYSASSVENSAEETLESVRAAAESADTSTAWTIFQTIAGVLVFSFGLLPTWLDVSLLVVRAIGWVIVGKWIRGVSS